MTQEITLNWKGPHTLNTEDARKRFSLPNKPGVYIWCVGKPGSFHLSYVGYAVDLQKRMYEHIFWMLGGRYCLYGDDHLIECKPPKPVYTPSFENLVTDFLGDFSRYSDLAFRNLTYTTLFWAVVDQNSIDLRAVESAIISKGKENDEPLQNDRLSLKPENSSSLMIKLEFESGFGVNVLLSNISFGE